MPEKNADTQVCAQVDFRGVNAENSSIESLIKFFKENILENEEVPEKMRIIILKAELDSVDSDEGLIGTQIDFNLEDLLLLDEEEEEEDNESYEDKARSIIENSLKSICDRESIELDISDIDVG